MSRKSAALIALVALASVVIGVHQTRERKVAPDPIGMVRATEIRIASEVGGRLRAIPVKPGDIVRSGDLLAVLENPELEAALFEAQAGATAARAARDRVYAGKRREQVDILERNIQKALSNQTLAEQSYARIAALVANQNASRQALDRAEADISRARSALAAARSRHGEAQAGPTSEERASADAEVAAAEAAVQVVERKLDKTRLTAPAAGVVRIIVSEIGEAVQPGKPLLTLEVTRDRWFSFTLREDDLTGVTIGAQLPIEGPGGRLLTAQVTEIRGLGAFATWRAARAVGDHDLNSFAVRLDPSEAVSDLEPGMSVWIVRP